MATPVGTPSVPSRSSPGANATTSGHAPIYSGRMTTLGRSLPSRPHPRLGRQLRHRLRPPSPPPPGSAGWPEWLLGADAGRYDRARPGYPAAMVDRIVAESPGRDVVDAGCGTGISARLLQAAGCRVLGVDPDPRMAELARGSGLDVEVAKFEQWDAAGRTFDAVIAGQAWHWVQHGGRGGQGGGGAAPRAAGWRCSGTRSIRRPTAARPSGRSTSGWCPTRRWQRGSGPGPRPSST